jgi:flagellar biosynthesis protein FlgN
MSNAALRVKTVIQGLAEDRQHYLDLQGLLAEQREHIVVRNSASLDQVNAQIMERFQQLTHNSQQRYRGLNELGIQASAYGMQSLIARLPVPHKEKVGALWQELQQLATACQASNEANGALMHMQQEILLNLLNVGEPENWLYQQG